ncbi:hypothetical protein [Pseudanabaena sp. PCC 6802]|uniref:hypothetical protein n=1 Tax=Pseudanabaena sp. PCC 6802 TaxID=118173 RepID=UPI0003477735|nr:hypothetical protein [Pseudanabaena sp. PCC 6802]
MKPEKPSTRVRQKAPKAAAIAGIVFSVLLIVSLSLILISLPANPREGGDWLSTSRNTILLALNLVPFTGIAFLWFIGVMRDYLGENEDRFFATVFLGSGLLFLAMLFSFGALAGSLILLYLSQTNPLSASGLYDLGFTTAREILNNYGIKMAGVFMISTSTLFIRTQAIPRWMALLGYALAALMLLRVAHIDRLAWPVLGFPTWVLMISVHILMDNYRKKAEAESL